MLELSGSEYQFFEIIEVFQGQSNCLNIPTLKFRHSKVEPRTYPILAFACMATILYLL